MPSQTDDIDAVIRSRMQDFAKAWNAGDKPAVIAQYDAGLFGIYGADFCDYAKYTGSVVEGLFQADRADMNLDVHEVRSLGADFALVNGRVHMHSVPAVSALFTVAYKRSGGEWKIVYSHS